MEGPLFIETLNVLKGQGVMAKTLIEFHNQAHSRYVTVVEPHQLLQLRPSKTADSPIYAIE